MNVLITGARGMLGTDLSSIFARGNHVTSTDIDDMDVRDRDAIANVAADCRPDLIIHLAALTDVDGCEREPDEAFRTNTIGTQNVALVCQQLEIPMVYLSTISVFDGTKPESYTEFDTPNPQSYYSRSKYQGERILQSLLRRCYIVRAGWMFGGGKKDKKFVAKIVELAQTRDELKIVNDKFGSPTYTVDISRGVLNLVETGQYGIYHLVNTGQPASRYEVAKAIFEYAGITGCELRPVSSAEFPLPAPRPRMEAGRNLVAELIGLPSMRPWQEALKEYIQTTLLGDEP
jgi:dTDP-4-dehydrorhamnose reductase